MAYTCCAVIDAFVNCFAHHESCLCSAIKTPTVLNKPLHLLDELYALYSGEVDAHGQPHGPGELTCTFGPFKGLVHTGMFVHGEPRGVGKIVFPSGDILTGEVYRGNLSGLARVEWPNGACYEGPCEGGKEHGLATFTYSDGRKYIGWWAHGEPHGIALFVYADGSKEACSWERNKLVSRTSGYIDDVSTISLTFDRSPGGGATRERNEGCDVIDVSPLILMLILMLLLLHRLLS
jgi:hypothetical protein